MRVNWVNMCNKCSSKLIELAGWLPRIFPRSAIFHCNFWNPNLNLIQWSCGESCRHFLGVGVPPKNALLGCATAFKSRHVPKFPNFPKLFGTVVAFLRIWNQITLIGSGIAVLEGISMPLRSFKWFKILLHSWQSRTLFVAGWIARRAKHKNVVLVWGDTEKLKKGVGMTEIDRGLPRFTHQDQCKKASFAAMPWCRQHLILLLGRGSKSAPFKTTTSQVVPFLVASTLEPAISVLKKTCLVGVRGGIRSWTETVQTDQAAIVVSVFTDHTLAHPLNCRGGVVARLSA